MDYRIKSAYLVAAIGLCAAFTAAAQAGDVAAGEKSYLAKGCNACHGPDGNSHSEELYPSMAGNAAAYLVEQLKAFRDGSRQNPMMGPMATMLTDDEIANIAAYLAAQTPK